MKVPVSAKAMFEKFRRDPVAVYKIYGEKLPENMLFKAKVVSLKQEGDGKEFELRSQTPTKQP